MVGVIGAANTLQDLPELLASFGEAAALISFKAGASETLTFRDLVERARKMAEALRDRGVGAGEPVGILAPNGPLWVTACLAILSTGAAVVPVDVQQTKTEQVRLLKMTGCRFFLSDLAGSGVGLRDCSFTSPLITEFPILYSFSLSPGLKHNVKAAASHVARPSDVALIVHTPSTAGTPRAIPLSSCEYSVESQRSSRDWRRRPFGAGTYTVAASSYLSFGGWPLPSAEHGRFRCATRRLQRAGIRARLARRRCDRAHRRAPAL